MEAGDGGQKRPQIKLTEINPYLTCHLCKGYLIDATTISECLHSFCRSCIIEFLQENSHCPVCEVIINKAKPNLKLDKTLQDIVYKMVPGLFLNEMKRRKEFYLNHPGLSVKVSPEERGEDTERTIFNPQDCISLSIEYIRDDSTPGAIPILSDKDQAKSGAEDVQESQMKRYLQCPGMCRVEVLKKFVSSKYGVNTAKFHIEILYKRVPLPDHYTLIDIAYIYSWKRNEPMTFYFRITDINKVSERFDYFDGKTSPELVVRAPVRSRYVDRTRKRAQNKIVKVPASQVSKTTADVAKNVTKCDVKVETEVKKEDDASKLSECAKNEVIKTAAASESVVTSTVPPSEKKNVYTNITLNRSTNMEIITKIQKVSNKDGQPIGLNIIKQTVKKVAESQIKPEKQIKTEPEVDEEKQKFLQSIELTAKHLLQIKPADAVKKPEVVVKLPAPSKRKNSSPVKNDKVKRAKKPTTKIILQSKPQNGLQNLFGDCKINIPSSLSITLKDSGENTTVPAAPVKNFIEILKITDGEKVVEDSDQKIDEDLSKIAKSLTEKIPMSTTISQSFGPKTSFSIPVKTVPKYPTQPAPVPEVASCKPKTEAPVKLNPRNSQTFQKIFEESIKKPTSPKSEPPPPPVEMAGNELVATQKRNISDIISELCKKSQMEVEVKTEEAKKPEAAPKVPIPRLPNNRKPKSPRVVKQQLDNLHSNSLGLTYSVSVERSPKKAKFNGISSPVKSPGDLTIALPPEKTSESSTTPKLETKPTAIPKNLSPHLAGVSPRHQSPKSSPVVKHMYAPSARLRIPSPGVAKASSCPGSPLNPNHLLEKYNIQNLAQLSASMNIAAPGFSVNANQLAAFQHAMLLKQFELQNQQNWLTMNQGPLLQYEKYLQQSVNPKQGQLLSNIKEN